MRLFKSHREGIADGDQRRDFIYVDDAVSVLRWLLEATGINGIFNVGTGKAESFRDMIAAMFKALRLPVNIEYIDMPEAIRGQYQYFTEARIERLRAQAITPASCRSRRPSTSTSPVISAVTPLSVTRCTISTSILRSSPSRPCYASAI